MFVKGLTEGQIREALDKVNADYDNNLQFKRLEAKGNRFVVTITVNDSKGAGASYNPITDRAISAACWHAHGSFIDALLDSGAEYVKALDNKIESPADNWQDFNCGSKYQPIYASERCHC